MKICFVCCRPFQLLNSINYIENKLGNLNDYNIDLFFLNKFRNDVDLSQLNYFRNTFYFNEEKSGTIFDRLKKYIFLGKYIRRNCVGLGDSQIKNYNIIIGTSYNDFLIRLCNLNNKAELIMLDDGIGSYMKEERLTYQKSTFFNVLNIFHRGVLSLKVSKMYCYRPEVMCVHRDYPVFPLPKLSDCTLRLMESVFQYEEGKIIKDKKIIYFSTDDVWEKEYNFNEHMFLQILSEYKDQVIIRFHPNRINKKYENMDVDDATQLWELRCRQMMNDSVLIGIFSTAQFSPYFLYGKNSTIILLYKIVFPSASYLFKQCEMMVKVLKREGVKVLVPNNLEEYKNVLKSVIQLQIL